MASSDDFPAEFSGAVGRLQVAVLEACRRQQEWPAKIAMAIAAAADFSVSDPSEVRLMTFEGEHREVHQRGQQALETRGLFPVQPRVEQRLDTADYPRSGDSRGRVPPGKLIAYLTVEAGSEMVEEVVAATQGSWARRARLDHQRCRSVRLLDDEAQKLLEASSDAFPPVALRDRDHFPDPST